MSDFWRLITLGDPNTRVVLLGASLLGLTSGVIGTFTVLRRRALVGDALAHAALPGICTAYLIVGDKAADLVSTRNKIVETFPEIVELRCHMVGGTMYRDTYVKVCGKLGIKPMPERQDGPTTQPGL